jgi:prepilin-type N-terminal cleavage/methylation domain-containing protein
MRSISKVTQAGFTLVELLIVVIILAVLAAIVVPQFSASTTEAKEAALDANLSRMRSAIELYAAQHGGTYPGQKTASGGTCPAGTGVTNGTGAANTAQAAIDQLTLFTDANGVACGLSDTTYKYGPYLRKGIPADSIKSVAALTVPASCCTGVPLAPSADTGGWLYDTKSGQLVMNSNLTDSKSQPWTKH